MRAQLIILLTLGGLLFASCKREIKVACVGDSITEGVTGIGSCLLTDNKRNMTDLFDTGREVVTYDDPEDCINKIKWLLEREDERDKIAHLGHKKTLESHKVYDRCKSIIDIINKEL